MNHTIHLRQRIPHPAAHHISHQTKTRLLLAAAVVLGMILMLSQNAS